MLRMKGPLMSDPVDPPRTPSRDAARPGMPRWVKVFGLILVALLLVFLAAQLLGVEHGPGMHGAAGTAPEVSAVGLRS